MTTTFYQALPSYFGGKRLLLPHIHSAITSCVPESEWGQYQFLDAFAGAGSVSLWAKTQPFKALHSNDFSHRSQIVLNALISNQNVRILQTFAEMLYEPSSENGGYVQSTYAGSVFSTRNAIALDRMLNWVDSTHCSVQVSLRRLVLWKLMSYAVGYGTSIGVSNRNSAEAIDAGCFDQLNPKRLLDRSFERQAQPLLLQVPKLVELVNQAVFTAEPFVSISQLDVLELLPKIQSDIAYFDPPYADTVGYGQQLAVLDDVLFGGEMPVMPDSVFTGSVDALKIMFDLAKHIPVWVLSYNDKVLNCEALQELVLSVDPRRKVQGVAIPYKHMAHVSKRDNNELIVTASLI